MANNQYVNKVQLANGTTLIDITDTTAEAADVVQGKYFYTASGAKVEGTAPAGGQITIVDTQDSHGGIIREITAEVVRLQSKSNITPTESSQTITPDTNYTGMSSVQINAISSTYVGSGIARKSSSDLTVSGATVTAPAGYYSSAASESVASGSVTSPSTISGTSATVSTGTNTLTLTKSVSVTPNVTTPGYVSSGTAGSSSVSLTANVTTKAAATITPTKSTQTIASGTYLTGTQTIAAIPAAYQDVTGVTAAAGDVVSGKSIVDSSGNTVNGSLVIQHYYTGSGTPSASTGVNGDIYLKTS